MSTAGQVKNGDLAPCWHCRSAVAFHFFDGGTRVKVACRCGVCGPAMETELEAMQAWNGVSVLGRVGIVHGKAGIPNHTTALAEHLRLLSEQVAAGVYDAPDSYIVILVTQQGANVSPRVHASTHNIGADGVARVCEKVRQSADVRNAIKRIGNNPR